MSTSSFELMEYVRIEDAERSQRESYREGWEACEASREGEGVVVLLAGIVIGSLATGLIALVVHLA